MMRLYDEVHDFRAKGEKEQGKKLGALIDYVEAPLSAKMSYPPQSPTVRKDLTSRIRENRMMESKSITSLANHTHGSAFFPKGSFRLPDILRPYTVDANFHATSASVQRSAESSPTTLRNIAGRKKRKSHHHYQESARAPRMHLVPQESEVLVSKEERAYRQTVERLKTDVGMMRSQKANLKAFARHKQHYVNDLVRNNRGLAGNLRIYHSESSRHYIRPTDTIYNSTSSTSTVPSPRHSPSKYASYRGVDDVKRLTQKLNFGKLREPATPEAQLTDLIKSACFHHSLEQNQSGLEQKWKQLKGGLNTVLHDRSETRDSSFEPEKVSKTIFEQRGISRERKSDPKALEAAMAFSRFATIRKQKILGTEVKFNCGTEVRFEKT